MDGKKNVPEIRFRGFSGEWEDRKLKDVSTYFNGGSFENNVLENGRYELVTLKSVDMGGNLVHSERYIDVKVSTLMKGTLVMILSEQSPGLLGMTAQIPLDNRYVLNQRVAEIRPNQGVDSYFLSMSINRNQQYFSSRGAGTKVQNISKPNVENFGFFYPLIKEQSRIGTFFQHLDHLITLHQKKYNKLTNIKKAMLEKMFPKNGADVPGIRFEGFEGKWEKRKLGEVVSIKSGWSPSNFNFGEILFIKVDDLNYSSREQLESKLKVSLNSCFTLIKEGSIIFPKRGAAIMTNKVRIMSGIGYMDTNMMALEPINVKTSFLYLFINRTGLYKIADTSTIPQINNKHIEPYMIQIPSEIEQTKIGTYFQSLDKIITLHQTQIVKLKNIKKACLEKMFV